MMNVLKCLLIVWTYIGWYVFFSVATSHLFGENMYLTILTTPVTFAPVILMMAIEEHKKSSNLDK